MDLNKLIRRKEKAKNEENPQLVAETCHKLGNIYMSDSKLDSSLREFKQELSIRENLANNKIEIARVNRMIGEVLMLKGKYSEAQKHEQVYLKLAKECDDLVEQQRAYATIGRLHLLRAEDESVCGSDNPVNDYKAAEKSFLKSLIICKELGKLVTKWELADMQGRLYLNLGVTKEHVEEFEEAINYYETAIKISKANELHELQQQCLMASGFNYTSKRHDNATALNIFNQALDVCKRIHDKNEKTCETLLAISGVLIKNSDFQGAKQTLKKAYKLKTPNKNDKDAINKMLKVVYTICKCEDELLITNSYDYAKRRNLFEKLGDGACKLKNFTKAIDFYMKTLESAELNGEDAKQMVPIYVSLYQTYIDNKDYKKALEYMRKEYEIIKDDAKEAAQTLLGIANISDLSEADFWEVEMIFKQALEQSRKTTPTDSQLECNILKKFIQFCRKREMMTIADMLEQEAIGKGIEMTTSETSEEFCESSEDILDICDDIDLDLVLSSDEDSQKSCNNTSRRTKRTTKKQTLKINAKGETKLHEACISGNYQLAKLLLDQGHGVNVRDNAGWLPLHEAANHGFTDIVELLLDHGAAINDKGGVSCDGITPLHDAACNGHLSTVLKLLEKGAKATMKTNFNETALEMLHRWHKENSRGMSNAEKEIYEEIQSKLAEQCERVGIEIKSSVVEERNSGASSSGYQSEKKQSPLNSSLRYKAIISDESEDENDDVKILSSKSKNNPVQDENIARNARDEYRNVMKSLKNPHKQQQRFVSEQQNFEVKRKSALLTESDVDIQDWLEDDLGPIKKKPRTSTNNDAISTLQRKSSRTLTEHQDKGLEIKGNVIISSDEDAFFDHEMTLIGLQTNSPNFKSQEHHKQQSTLLEKGFSRFIEPEISSSKSKENLIPDSVDKQIIIKVQVGDERVIVPIQREHINNYKINWLIEETSNRYYLLKGIRPDLLLKTIDGATLLPTDTLALIFSLTDENLIHSEILDWKLPPLEKRYIEACSEYKCNVDPFMNEVLSNNRNSLAIHLANLNLSSASVRPIMKSLQHQSILNEINLASNFVLNDGIKFLAQTLNTLKCLNSLDISGNMVTEIGVEYLSKTLQKSQLPSEIRLLNVSFNPIKSSSLKFISDIVRMKNVQALSMISCDLSTVDHISDMSPLKHVNISYNHFSSNALKKFLHELNSCNVESLNLEQCSNDSQLGEVIVDFIQSGSYLSLVELNLSGLELNENEILDIFRCIDKCQKLKIINMSKTNRLTFLAVKYLLYSLDCQTLERIVLLNCRQLRTVTNLECLKPSNNVTTHRRNLRQIQLSLPRETSIKNEFVDSLKEFWAFLCEGHDKIEETKTTLFLSRDDARTPY